MGTQCKLYTNVKQSIPPKTWTTLRFDVALRNDRKMFRGSEGSLSSRENGLIHPPQNGDFLWCRFVKWEDITIPKGDTRPRQFMEQFCRDPYSKTWDSTASFDGEDTPGEEFHVNAWVFRGKRDHPIGVRVWHDHSEPVNIIHAQFSGTTWDY